MLGSAIIRSSKSLIEVSCLVFLFKEMKSDTTSRAATRFVTRSRYIDTRELVKRSADTEGVWDVPKPHTKICCGFR